ncbi:RagB/SusD family nutrient uptake outer membrane protein [Cesiribacter sp. SM1]|uniref:RagB/SusD family nutrient uptake outer membrane protein n=1 Tax=Cesiribacter sp. SM1 TaxID=2861196 RepID=UPI001CD7EA3B|nr:RagB/SusD family nutrient uptake outer membrane protein [Cesiribacter sp. SM1]
MKKIFILALMSCGILLGSCEDNFDPTITGTLAPANFPKTEADFELYTLQAYKPFGAKWGYADVAWQNMFHGYEYGHVIMFDLPTDLFIPFTAWGGFFEFFSKADFDFLKNQDKTSHFEKVRYVTRMTQIIADIEASSLEEEAKQRFIAEARMGRGLTMYYLLHMYGPLPVIMDPAEIGTAAESDLSRPNRETFVGYIEDDLTYAAEHLAVSPEQYGRFNKGLALGILMRLHLNEKNWESAKAAGRQLQGLGYSLYNDYAGLFREITEKNLETIWAVSIDPAATGNNLQGDFNAWPLYNLPSDFQGKNVNGGWPPMGVFTPSWEFYDSFDPADKRRALMVESYLAKDGTQKDRSNMPGPVLAKYPDESGPEFQGNDIPILRFADVLLMLAEAINNTEGPTQEAIDLVNEVRSVHGGIAGLSESETASPEAFNEAILRERAFDLYFEGVRKMDLVRHGKWESALQQAGKNPGPALFPVPQYAIDVSDGTLSQTQGY